MKILIQRVSKAEVFVNDKSVADIGTGILAFVGVAKDDDGSEIPWLARKLAELRIFPDDKGKMNLSVKDAGGSILLVSQFTLCAATSKGRRPDFFTAAPPDIAEGLFNAFVDELKNNGVEVRTGVFGASMQVHLINDGPVTFIIEK